MWHFVHRSDPNLTSPFRLNRKLNISKHHILWTTKDIFTILTSSYRSIIILHFIHRHDPNLTSSFRSKTKVSYTSMNSLFMRIRIELYEASCTGSLCRVRDNKPFRYCDCACAKVSCQRLFGDKQSQLVIVFVCRPMAIHLFSHWFWGL